MNLNWQFQCKTTEHKLHKIWRWQNFCNISGKRAHPSKNKRLNTVCSNATKLKGKMCVDTGSIGQRILFLSFAILCTSGHRFLKILSICHKSCVLNLGVMDVLTNIRYLGTLCVKWEFKCPLSGHRWCWTFYLHRNVSWFFHKGHE